MRDKKIYYHALGTQQSADRLIYERRRRADAVHRRRHWTRPAGTCSSHTNKGTSNKNELFVKDLGDPIAPKLDAPVRALYPGHTAAYDPLGVVNGTLYLLTDRERAEQEGRRGADRSARRGELEDDRAGEQERDRVCAARSPGKLAVNALVDVASDAALLRPRRHRRPATITTPDLGTITGPSGRFDRPEIFYTFTSPLYPATVFRFDLGDRQRARRSRRRS